MASKKDIAFMKAAKAKLPPYNDLILPALKAVRRNPELSGLRSQFAEILAQAKIFTLKNCGRILTVPVEINGTTQLCVTCFSSPHHALLAWAKLSRKGGTQGIVPEIAEERAYQVFLASVEGGFHVYLNFQSVPGESYIYNVEEANDFLLTAPWPSNVNPTFGFASLNAKAVAGPDKADSHTDRELRRSKQGRDIIIAAASELPFSEIDFDRPMTKHQMAAIFGTSENEIARQMAGLANKGILNISDHSINIAEQDARKTPNHYDSLVAFHIGNQLDAPRGHEFRQWLSGQIYNFWREESALKTENKRLEDQLETAANTVKNLESSIREKDAAFEGLRSAASQLNQENLNLKRLIADLRNDLGAVNAWDFPESIMDAKRIAAAKYSSKLIFHERVDQSIQDFSLNQNLNAAVSAARIFKALAENLHRSKFEKGSFSEEQFRDETGLEMSMTESKASKRDQAVWESRTCLYNGEEITFFPHVKDTIQGVKFRVHFQFLDQEGKIIICHAGEHLLNAQTKHLS
ncbi:MAG: hypothetical protein LBP33_07900 [Candidatus Adiutrix sp.]|jgi:hypothetical protein|nr:hypothetical protein [Candidatus Adiutrix sp.]